MISEAKRQWKTEKKRAISRHKSPEIYAYAAHRTEPGQSIPLVYSFPRTCTMHQLSINLTTFIRIVFLIYNFLKVKFAIIGYGKMGREIHRIIESRGGEVVLIIDKDNAEDMSVQNLQKVDVAIEFSTPDTAYSNIVKCLEAGVPMVCGTTAWLERLSEVEELCKAKNGKFFYASNYSIGVNLFFKINAELAKLMQPFEQYDVTVEEVHHTQKKDAPSGTAITIAEGILEGISRKQEWVLGDTCDAGKLGVAAIRRSIVPGTHTVTWESEVDTIEIQHTAKSRAGFALGAVVAAEFLVKQPSGIYSMNDLL